MYFTSLIITTWLFYERSEACCLRLREDLRCPADLNVACRGQGTSTHPTVTPQLIWFKPLTDNQ